MSHVAFYAPMKPPWHPVPSGDRTLARLLLRALRRAGFRPELASTLRSYDGRGDPGVQQALKRRALARADALIAAYRLRPAGEQPQAWFTYHLYHKAPDWIGPRVCRALDIPYLLCEASHAPRQEHGPWASNLADCAEAIRQAARIFMLNPRDLDGLALLRPDSATVVQRLPPFLSPLPAPSVRRAELARLTGLDPERPWLISVAMLRPGDKMASYRLMIESYRRLLAAGRRLHWLVIGDGAAAAEFDTLAAGLDGIRRLGQLPPAEAAPWLAAADLFVWPAVNEAFGMALLEAQAAGCAVLAGANAGVASVAGPDSALLLPDGDAAAFARAIGALLDDAPRRRGMAAAGPHYVMQHHSIDAAAARLKQGWPPRPAPAADPTSLRGSHEKEPHPDLQP